MQGRRKLPKAGWSSTNVEDTIYPPLVDIALTDLQKPGWAIAHSVHLSPTSLICKNCLKIPQTKLYQAKQTIATYIS